MTNPNSSPKFETVTENGAWCWFSDPRAVRHVGKYDRTYIGSISKEGSVIVCQYDHDSKEMQEITVRENFEYDDHNNPSFLILRDGNIIVFYAKHGTDKRMCYRVTTSPEDLTTLGEEQWIDTQDSITYHNPYILEDEDDKIYLFWRGIGWQPTFATSTDNGATWSSPVQLVKIKDRPYIKYVTNGKDKIHFAFTDGHPRTNPEQKIYYAYLQCGAYYKSDGTKIKNVTDGPLSSDEVDTIYAGINNGRSERGWIWDIALDENSLPVITYTTSPGEGKDNLEKTSGIEHYYRYARFDGKNWSNHDVVFGGKWFPTTPSNSIEREPHYAGGVMLDHSNPSVVYLSRPVNDVFEIEKWVTNDGGETWETTAITLNSSKDNVRPFATRNGKDGEFYLSWMQINSYPHFLEYDTSILANNPVIPELKRHFVKLG